jgi:hypothetical protein
MQVARTTCWQLAQGELIYLIPLGWLVAPGAKHSGRTYCISVGFYTGKSGQLALGDDLGLHSLKDMKCSAYAVAAMIKAMAPAPGVSKVPVQRPLVQ